MITACVTNWHNPALTEKVCKALSNQTVKPKIWVWDNSGIYHRFPFADDVFSSSVNMMSYGGLLPLGGVQTEYSLKIDDDVLLEDETFLEHGLAIVNTNPEGVCCIMGRNIPDTPPYYPSKPGSAQWNVDEDYHCDLATGQCMLFKSDILRHVPMKSLNNYTEEDITLSLYAPARHIVPAIWTGMWSHIPKKDCISNGKGHWARREDFVRRNIYGFRSKAQR